MSVVVGTGEYRYEVVQDWAKLPEGWSFFEVAAVGVDRHDNVYAFNRGEHPVMVFDHNGKFLRSWGEGIFGHAHGLHVAPDDTLFLTDDLDHTVRKCTTQGKVLLTIGTPGKPAPFMSGLPFTAVRIPLSPLKATSMSQMATATRASTSTHPTGGLLNRGAKVARCRGSSTSRTTSPVTRMAEFMSQIAKTTVSRYSTGKAGSKRNGTTCTDPAQCIWTIAAARYATWLRWVLR